MARGNMLPGVGEEVMSHARLFQRSCRPLSACGASSGRNAVMMRVSLKEACGLLQTHSHHHRIPPGGMELQREARELQRSKKSGMTHIYKHTSLFYHEKESYRILQCNN